MEFAWSFGMSVFSHTCLYQKLWPWNLESSKASIFILICFFKVKITWSIIAYPILIFIDIVTSEFLDIFFPRPLQLLYQMLVCKVFIDCLFIYCWWVGPKWQKVFTTSDIFTINFLLYISLVCGGENKSNNKMEIAAPFFLPVFCSWLGSNPTPLFA